MHETRLENLRKGSRGWWAAMAPPDTLEGYASQDSVTPGDVLELRVAAPRPVRYRVNVYRLGWYDGAGGRLLARTPVAEARPQHLPGPEEPDPIRVDWPVTDVVPVGDWPSGQYVAQLQVLSGTSLANVVHVPFVVRRRPEAEPAALLVQTPVTTAQAYNNWGGRSLYPSNSHDRVAAQRVSFDRPYQSWERANINARAPFTWDIQLIRYLERLGVDVEYQTDIDTHRDPRRLLAARALMSSGHDEYWTFEMRAAWEQARDAGASLFFMGANTCYWQARLEDDTRTLVVYRVASEDPAPDPARKTIRWRDLATPRPEHTLMGVQFQDGLGDPHDVRDYLVTAEAASHPWAKGKDVDGPLKGLVGYEWDGLVAGSEPRGLTRLLHYGGTPPADCVSFPTAAGGWVFATGSLQFSWGLDDWARNRADTRVQDLLKAALGNALRR